MCDKCKDTGLIPFIKNDKVIPFVFQDCGCEEPPIEHYQPLSPDAFDYPMSDTFRGFAYQYCGQADPGYSQPKTVIREKTKTQIVRVEPKFEARKPVISTSYKGIR